MTGPARRTAVERQPKYLRIYTELRDRIEGGRWPAGTALPAQRELADEFGVSMMTLRQAVQLLADEGLVGTRHGLGTYVTPRFAHDLGHLRSFASDLAAQGAPVTTRLLDAAAVTPPEAVGARLGGPARALRLRRLRLVGGQPVILQTSWLPVPLPGGLDPRGLLAGAGVAAPGWSRPGRRRPRRPWPLHAAGRPRPGRRAGQRDDHPGDAESGRRPRPRAPGGHPGPAQPPRQLHRRRRPAHRRPRPAARRQRRPHRQPLRGPDRGQLHARGAACRLALTPRRPGRGGPPPGAGTPAGRDRQCGPECRPGGRLGASATEPGEGQCLLSRQAASRLSSRRAGRSRSGRRLRSDSASAMTPAGMA